MSSEHNQQDLLKYTKVLVAVVVLQALLLLVGGGIVMAIALPKVERAVSVSERMEARFQSFAQKVEPVVDAGAFKAVESIKKVDAAAVGETITTDVNESLDNAKESAKRFFERNKK